MTAPIRIRLGTRGSALARWQADWVAARLTELGAEVVLEHIVTSGDRQQEGAIGELGAQGLFTKEIQRAVLDGRVDLAVHSLKDLPTDAVEGLALAAVPPRASTADVLVSAKYPSLDALPSGAVVGTGSLRRRAQLLNVRPDLTVADIRGNVDTRLRKLDQGNYDAIVLAQAGLQRLGLSERITQVLPEEVMLPAVGQGALGLETRADDGPVRHFVAQLDHAPSHVAVIAERAMLAALHGGCLAPIAAIGRLENGRLTLTGRVLSSDGTQKLEITLSGDPTEPAALGLEVASSLHDQGAAMLIRAV